MSFRPFAVFAVSAAAIVCACSTKNESVSITWPPLDEAASAIALLASSRRDEVLSLEVDAPFDQPLIFSLPEAWDAQPAEVDLSIASYSCTLDQLGYGPAQAQDQLELLASTASVFVRGLDEPEWRSASSLPGALADVQLRRHPACQEPVVNAVTAPNGRVWVKRWGDDAALLATRQRLLRLERSGTTTDIGENTLGRFAIQRDDDELFVMDDENIIRRGPPGGSFVEVTRLPLDDTPRPLRDVAAAISGTGPLELVVATSSSVQYFADGEWKWSRPSIALEIVRWVSEGSVVSFPVVHGSRMSFYDASGLIFDDTAPFVIFDALFVEGLGLLVSASDGSVSIHAGEHDWRRLDLQGNGMPVLLAQTPSGFATVELTGFLQPYVIGSGFCPPFVVSGTGAEGALARPSGLLHEAFDSISFVDLRTRRECPRPSRSP